MNSGYSVGDRVRVRDTESEPWRLGNVTSEYPLKVKPDGWDMAMSWRFMEKATQEHEREAQASQSKPQRAPEATNGRNGEALTIDDLRAELRQFEGEMRRGLRMDLRDEIREELAIQMESLREAQRQEMFTQLNHLRADLRMQPARTLPPRPAEALAPPRTASRDDPTYSSLPTEGGDAAETQLLVKDQREVHTTTARFQMDEDDDEMGENGAKKTWAEKLVRSTEFDLVVCTLVLVNISFFAWQTDYTGRYYPDKKPQFFEVAELFFCLFYCAELAMKLSVRGFKNYFFGNEGKISYFNWFDTFLVFAQVCEQIWSFTRGTEHQSKMTRHLTLGLKILRIARIARISRVLHLVPNFRMLCVSILFSLKSLMWVIMLISISTLSFGIVLTQLVTDYRHEMEEEVREPEFETEKLEEFFGTLDRSMLVLYAIISDGMHWWEAVEPLEKCITRWTVLIFIAYTLLSVLAMMNVLTAFFVETAVKAGVEDKKTNMIQEMWHIFDKKTAGPDKVITEEVFVSQMDDPRMVAYLKEMELEADDVKDSHFFQILDRDSSGGVDLSELIQGCVRLTQVAKSIDVASLGYLMEQERREQEAFRHKVLKSLQQEGQAQAA